MRVTTTPQKNSAILSIIIPYRKQDKNKYQASKYLEPIIPRKYLVALQFLDPQETTEKRSNQNSQTLPPKNNSYYSLSTFQIKVKLVRMYCPRCLINMIKTQCFCNLLAFVGHYRFKQVIRLKHNV